MSITAQLKARCRRAGADICGIAPALPLPEASRLDDWLREGRQASMHFLERDAAMRRDIRAWYPEARSVLVCGFALGAGGPGPAGGGRIARYAAHEDYHQALRRRLESVLEWLKEVSPGAEGRVFVDSSPVLERFYGCHAGLGWIGRNCLLVNEELGSFFLIAGAALTLELDCDQPAPDRCGSCQRCLAACPAGALVRERTLDAGLCTAYLTVEHRGALPLERRAAMGRWVAGCDLCQEACPHNAKTLSGVLEPLLPREIPLEDLVGSDDERFKTTPISRLKRQGLSRNALLAMGNSGEARFRPILQRFLRDPDPVLAEQAAWSLSRLPERVQS